MWLCFSKKKSRTSEFQETMGIGEFDQIPHVNLLKLKLFLTPTINQPINYGDPVHRFFSFSAIFITKAKGFSRKWKGG